VIIEGGSSAAALCDIKGQVVGVCKVAWPGNRCNIATEIHVLVLALRNTFRSRRSARAPKSVSKAEIQNSKFISPSSFKGPPLWWDRGSFLRFGSTSSCCEGLEPRRDARLCDTMGCSIQGFNGMIGRGQKRQTDRQRS
jgi:hypothetical protein